MSPGHPKHRVPESAWYPRACPAYAGSIVSVNSTAQVSGVIQEGLRRCPVALGQRFGSNILSIRASRQTYHSTVGFPCVNVNPGSCSIQLDMSQVQGIFASNPKKRKINVGPAVQMDHLMDSLHELGMTIASEYVPIYTGLTVGGMLLTGAHGSSIQWLSAFKHLVSRTTYVDGKGDVHEEENSTRWIASLGMVGIVTEMEIHTVDHYKLNTTVSMDDF